MPGEGEGCYDHDIGRKELMKTKYYVLVGPSNS